MHTYLMKDALLLLPLVSQSYLYIITMKRTEGEGWSVMGTCSPHMEYGNTLHETVRGQDTIYVSQWNLVVVVGAPDDSCSSMCMRHR